jgi:hypothetical protein
MDLIERMQRELHVRTGVSLPPGEAGRLVERSLGPSSHVNRPLTNLAVEYENAEYVADQVMPVIPEDKPSNTYFKFKPETMFSVADTELSSNEAVPGRVNYGLDTVGTFTTKSRGLMDFVSVEDQERADDPLEPMATSVEITKNFLLLAREIRVATATFLNTNYSSNHTSLAGADRWDQTTSDPVQQFLTYLKTPLVRPNAAVFGVEGWDYFRTHPKVIQYIIARASTSLGPTPLMVDQETVARAFRLEKVIVGESKYNTAKEGQTPSYSYVWGKSCALIRIEPQPNRKRTQTFGYTFRWGTFEVRSVFWELPGRMGGTYNKVTHADDENIVGGGNVGYLLETVIS